MASAVKTAFIAAQEATSVSEIESELDRGWLPEGSYFKRTDLGDIVSRAMTAHDATFMERVPDALLSTLNDAGTEAGISAKTAGTYRTLMEATLNFDIKNPKAEAWAREHSSQLITGITHETRVAIQSIIAAAQKAGIPPRSAARMIRELIGLNVSQAKAVGNAYNRLFKADDKLVQVGKRYFRVPPGGLSHAQASKIVEDYGRRLQNQRAISIARTETMAAANEGQRQLWEQGIDEGLLTGLELREWIFTPDTRSCHICASMSGIQVRIIEPFELPTGARVMGPPAHPMCRCSTGLTGEKAKPGAVPLQPVPVGPPPPKVTPVLPAPVPVPPPSVPDEYVSIEEMLGQGEIIGVKRLEDAEGGINKVLDARIKFRDTELKGVYKPISGEDQDIAEYFKKKGWMPQADREVLAYQIDDFLSLGMVPETAWTEGTLKFGPGSVQRFVPNAKTAFRTHRTQPDLARYVGSTDDKVKLNILDIITGQQDRHINNVIIDPKGKLWAIDNGLAGMVSDEMPDPVGMLNYRQEFRLKKSDLDKGVSRGFRESIADRIDSPEFRQLISEFPGLTDLEIEAMLYRAEWVSDRLRDNSLLTNIFDFPEAPI